MTALQKTVFLGTEGDHWFERNADGLADGRMAEIPLTMLAGVLRQGDAILEIGCANGANLARLSAQVGGLRTSGVDPSAKAIGQGRAAWPHLTLEVGTADALPFADAAFQAVWFGFSMYLLDRSLLMRVVSEADRVLCDGGVLAITDFDPPLPCCRPYRHAAGLFSYKMDYSRLFLANPGYVLMAKTGYAHGAAGFHRDPDERVATWLLQKSLAGVYRLQGREE